MSEDLNTPETPETPGENPDIKQLREKAKKHDDAEARAAAAERRVAVIEGAATAGIDLTDPKTKFFVDNYQGEPTADAFIAEATKYGFVTPATPPPANISPEETDALTRIANHAAGTSTPPVTPTQTQELQSAVRNGEVRSADEVGMWLAARGEPVSWEGPADGMEPRPWNQVV